MSAAGNPGSLKTTTVGFPPWARSAAGAIMINKAATVTIANLRMRLA